jgi:nucleotide-binding universal stress UspA family protein
MPSIEKILVPVELSDHSLPALNVAIDLCLSYGAGLTLLYVHETKAFELPEGFVENMPSELARMYNQIIAGLSRLERKARTSGVSRVEKRIVQGPVVDEIVRFSSGFDFVVIGTHARTRLGRLVTGSVAQQVLERASCEVVVVRAAKTRAGSGAELRA